MVSRQLHDELRGELRRRGLPSDYVERLAAEYDDHFNDLLEERSIDMGAARKLQNDQVNLEQRLGEPAQLAFFAAEQYHARNFWGRHPLVTYLLGPLPLLVLCFVVYGLAFWAAMRVIAFVTTHALGWTDTTFANSADFIWLQAVLLALLSWYAIVFPPLTAGWLLCRTYRRNALDWRWPFVGCILLAIVAALFNVSYNIATDPNSGQLMFGFHFNGSLRWMLLTFLPKFGIALGIGLLLIKRAEQKRVVAV
jgi:hypothetical protein